MSASSLVDASQVSLVDDLSMRASSLDPMVTLGCKTLKNNLKSGLVTINSQQGLYIMPISYYCNTYLPIALEERMQDSSFSYLKDISSDGSFLECIFDKDSHT